MRSKAADPDKYLMTYFKTKEDAEISVNEIIEPTRYSIENQTESQKLYIRVLFTKTGCFEIFELNLKSQKGILPEKRDDVVICGKYVFPELNNPLERYTLLTGFKGRVYEAGDVLDEPGKYTVYVSHLLEDLNCFEEISYRVTITPFIYAKVINDEVLECSLYKLKELPEHNKYFTESGGRGIELEPNSFIRSSQMIYVYAQSQDGVCTDESKFTITYLECPIQKGISPNGDGFNDRFDLSNHGGVTKVVIYNRFGSEVYSFKGIYTDQWYGQNKNGKLLPDGTYYFSITTERGLKTGWVQINR